MKWMPALIFGMGLITWVAWSADRPAPKDSPVPASSASDIAASRPAANPMLGPRGRLQLEGRPRRDAGGAGGQGRRGPDARPNANQDEPLTPEKVEQVLRFAHDNFPQVFERLQRLRQVDPAAFRDIVRRMRGRMDTILEANQRDPQLAQVLIEEHRLQIDIIELGQKYRRASSDSDRARIQEALGQQLRRQFDLNQKRTQMEIENLRRRLDDQERRMADRERRKEQILRRQLDAATKGPRPARDAEANQ